VTDDEIVTPTLSLSIAPGTISENGGVATATLTRTGDASQELVVTISTDDNSEVSTPVTVTIPAESTSTTFDVTGVDDAILDGTRSVAISANATGFETASDSIDVTDDETATVAIFAGSHGTEADELGPTAGSFGFTLSTAADFDLTIPLTLSGSAVGDVDFDNFTSFTIPAGEISGEFFVNVIDDDIAERTDILRLQLDAPGVAGLTVDVDHDQARILLLDNDIAAINVSQSAVTVSEPGTSTTFDVTLASEPTGPVTVELLIIDPTEVSTDVIQLTFTPANWNVAQTVAVTAVDDPDQDGSVDSEIILFVDPLGAPDLFQFAPATKVKVTTLDDEPAVGPITLDSVTFYNEDADRERHLSPEENGQRSLITHVEVVLDGVVTVPTGPVSNGSFAVQNMDNGRFVGLNVDSATAEGGKTIVVLSFAPGPDTEMRSLMDGNYEFTVDGAPLGVDGDNSGFVGGIGRTDPRIPKSIAGCRKQF
jgi:hypothetical protein